ncbi:hypothetical protein THAOC_36860 [Thalassiosira oceanica]|uniref:Uncharacterized protein n=1 Tax=Thalassiosira oceanica TaxID=159749 RepID=K0QZH7_THAOC|nr:hypothetical protein THAOC_36860 [Thalassiosira oceanica]|eukprot:EJK44590.1 hypothetical protein THAOC_36860 [Thalassiosira oceanica]
MGVGRPRSTRRLRSAPLCDHRPAAATAESPGDNPGLSRTLIPGTQSAARGRPGRLYASPPALVTPMKLGVDRPCRRLRSAPMCDHRPTAATAKSPGVTNRSLPTTKGATDAWNDSRRRHR